MFENFYEFFNVPERKESSKPVSLNSLQKSTRGFIELFSLYNGDSFGEGLYRLHDISNIDYWNENIAKAFPEFSKRLSCFGYDWLGRQFALDKQRMTDGQAQILMFEPGTGEVLEIPRNFIEFHNDEIPNYHDACLASEFFRNWKAINKTTLKHDVCVGYKVMLFLGGQDTIENLEKSNMDVYWEICSSLIKQTKNLAEVSEIKISKFNQ